MYFKDKPKMYFKCILNVIDMYFKRTLKTNPTLHMSTVLGLLDPT